MNLIIVSCVTKVELDMPVVTAHISYMYWGLCIGMRHGKREESCGEIGEREDCSSGDVEDNGVVVCKERKGEDSSALWLWQHREHSHAHLR